MVASLLVGSHTLLPTTISSRRRRALSSSLLPLSSLLIILLFPTPVHSLQTTNMFDFFKPVYYQIEKAVASKSIPSIKGVPNRWTWQDVTEKQQEEEAGQTFDHSAWDACLQRHVNNGETTINGIAGINGVDYEGMKQDADFEKYMTQLEQASPESLSRIEQLAFWINAYNALCVYLICRDLQPDMTSINNLSTAEVNVFDKPVAPIGQQQQQQQKMMSLNQIEHDKLRKQFAIPQVHACIVCASASCPNLLPRAYRADMILEQMNQQMTNWMQHPTKGMFVDGEKNRVMLSRIFLWFQDDFPSNLLEWLAQYVSADDDDDQFRRQVLLGSPSIRYFEYDWNLNKQS